MLRLFCLLTLAVSCTGAVAAAQQQIPLDPAVSVGRLPNGLRYYIRENRRPEKRAELRLAVNAGSVLEDPDQLGLAHVVEHMAFNGTAHFPKQALVDFIERTGMRFGAHLNAYTSFDETVYQLVVPTDSVHLLGQGFQILEDWAQGVTFDSVEVEKERGVVLEEWRLGLGAQQRMRNQQFPVLFRGSRYADRLPIGTQESLEGFQQEALRRFYRDWYRPDLMAVVAVGDFDKREVERLVRDRFSKIPARKAPRPRTLFAVQAQDSTGIAIATDKEATGTTVSIYFRRPAEERSSVAAYRKSLVAALYSQALSRRLGELAQQPDPPFIGAQAGTGNLVRPVDVFALNAAVSDTGIARGFAAVLTEVERVERHGFAATEVERAKRERLRDRERAFAERDHAESSGFADAYVRHYLAGEPMPSFAQEFELAKRLIPGITLEEVNRAARTWLGGKDRVLLVSAPEKPGVAVPPADSLLRLLEAVRRADIAAYRDAVSDAPLVAAELPEAAIVAEAHDSALNTTTWTLANGVRVILKPTGFKADEVLLAGYSPGGTSLTPDSLFLASRVATLAVGAGGLGAFSAVELRKKLAGIVVQIVPHLAAFEEGLVATASPEDLQALFELYYLHFTAPRADSAAFAALLANLRASLANRGASPQVAFQDTLQVTLAQHHPRSRPFTAAMADSLDLGRALAVYRDRFADASDFTFVMAGSFSIEKVRPLVRRYLGNLPALRRGEEPRDLGITPPPGIVVREVRKGIEPRSQTAIVFTGSLDYTPAERVALAHLAQVLEIKLREQLREELGGTYGVGVMASPTRVPRPQYNLTIQFGSAPERVDELVAAVFAQIDSLRQGRVGVKELAKIREMLVRARETDLKTNVFWVDQLSNAAKNGEDPHELLDLERELAQLTAEGVQRAARRYLDPGQYVRVTLLPEAKGAAAGS